MGVSINSSRGAGASLRCRREMAVFRGSPTRVVATVRIAKVSKAPRLPNACRASANTTGKTAPPRARMVKMTPSAVAASRVAMGGVSVSGECCIGRASNHDGKSSESEENDLEDIRGVRHEEQHQGEAKTWSQNEPFLGPRSVGPIPAKEGAGYPEGDQDGGQDLAEMEREMGGRNHGRWP